jgi:hypothetical protein
MPLREQKGSLGQWSRLSSTERINLAASRSSLNFWDDASIILIKKMTKKDSEYIFVYL